MHDTGFRGFHEYFNDSTLYDFTKSRSPSGLAALGANPSDGQNIAPILLKIHGSATVGHPETGFSIDDVKIVQYGKCSAACPLLSVFSHCFLFWKYVSVSSAVRYVRSDGSLFQAAARLVKNQHTKSEIR